MRLSVGASVGNQLSWHAPTCSRPSRESSPSPPPPPPSHSLSRHVELSTRKNSGCRRSRAQSGNIERRRDSLSFAECARARLHVPPPDAARRVNTRGRAQNTQTLAALCVSRNENLRKICGDRIDNKQGLFFCIE